MKAIKKLLKFLLVVIIILAIVVCGIYIYVRSSFGIDLFKVIGQLGSLNKQVDETVICANAFSDDDMAEAQIEVNSSVNNLITYSEANGYYVKTSNITGTMTQDIKLTDKQVGAMMQTVLSRTTGGTIEIDNEQVPFELKQVEFINLSESHVTLNCVVKLDISELKLELDNTSFKFIKKYIPDYFYLTTFVSVVKGENAFSYSTENASLKVNNLNATDTEDFFNTVYKLFNSFTASDISEQMSDMLLNALIGTQKDNGFAYSLSKVGATDYNFISEDNQIYFTVTK